MRLFVWLLVVSTLAQPAHSQSVVQNRAARLQRGANLPYLEEYWFGTAARDYTDYIQFTKLPEKKAYLQLMATLGLRTVRIPVCFDRWASRTAPYAIDQTRNWPVLDSLVSWALTAGLHVIIDNHHGQLDQTTLTTETGRVAAIWEQVARHYANTDPERVLFEVYNEPNNIDAARWQPIAAMLVARIRSVAPRHTIVLGGVDYNSLTGLESLQPVDDDNVIYTFHCYDPFIFTHQQADWIGAPVATGHIPFPYSSGPMPALAAAAKGTWGESAFKDYARSGTEAVLEATLQRATDWAIRTGKPVFCGEFGTYKPAADADSRCRYMTTVIAKLGRMQVPFCFWEWNGGFSLFTGEPSVSTLPICMKMALDAYDPNLITGLEPAPGTTLLLFPNPTDGTLTIRTGQAVSWVTVVDAAGRLVLSQPMKLAPGESGVLSVQALAGGTYWLSVLDAQGKTSTSGRFIR